MDNLAIKNEDSGESSAPTIAASANPVKPDFDIDRFLEKRSEFITKVNQIMVEGADYHIIQGKKSMAKGGAEKVANIFGWQARFTKDSDVMDALKVNGMIAFVCDLEKSSQFMGQGRGASTLSKNAGDPNKTVKMAQKAAYVDAVIRASGLSDFYTQDLEDMPAGTVQATAKPVQGAVTPHPTGNGYIKPSTAQIETIGKIIKEKGITKSEIIDAGFVGSVDQLTGGKGGTASELIGWLIKHTGNTESSYGNAPRNWGGSKHLPEDLPVIQQADEASRREVEAIGDSIKN